MAFLDRFVRFTREATSHYGWMSKGYNHRLSLIKKQKKKLFDMIWATKEDTVDCLGDYGTVVIWNKEKNLRSARVSSFPLFH